MQLGDARSGKLADNLPGFGRALRRAGVPVDSARMALAQEAAMLVGMDRRASHHHGQARVFQLQGGSAVGHVDIGGSGVNGAGGVSANAIDVVLFLRARDPAHVDDAREAAVAALRRRSGVTFDVAVAPRGA